MQPCKRFSAYGAVCSVCVTFRTLSHVLRSGCKTECLWRVPRSVVTHICSACSVSVYVHCCRYAYIHMFRMVRNGFEVCDSNAANALYTEQSAVHTSCVHTKSLFYEMFIVAQRSCTGQCRDVDARSEANTGNTTRGCGVAETTGSGK